jgi:hypothetical protein
MAQLPMGLCARLACARTGTHIMNTFLTEALNKLTTGGLREPYLLQSDVMVQDIWQQRQALIQKKNQEILQAIAQIELQHAADLDQLDQEYAMYLHMIAPHKSGT